jgi:hypothetical protein
MSTIRLALACLCLLVAGLIQAVEIAAVHPAVAETNLTTERVRDMLLGRVTTWKDGSPIIIVLIDDPPAEAARLKLTGRDSARLLRGWKRLVYAGTGAMPLVIHGLQEGLSTIAQHPGSIAVIPATVPGDRWRCITLMQRAGQ